MLIASVCFEVLKKCCVNLQGCIVFVCCSLDDDDSDIGPWSGFKEILYTLLSVYKID
jgi:hypothetical protein